MSRIDWAEVSCNSAPGKNRHACETWGPRYTAGECTCVREREREREGVSPLLTGQYKPYVCSDKVYISISIYTAL